MGNQNPVQKGKRKIKKPYYKWSKLATPNSIFRQSVDEVTRLNFWFRLLVMWSSCRGASSHPIWCRYFYSVLGLPTVLEWPGSSRNWPTVSRVPGEAHFVPEMCKLTTGQFSHFLTLTDKHNKKYNTLISEHCCSLMSVLYFLLCLSATHDLLLLAINKCHDKLQQNYRGWW